MFGKAFMGTLGVICALACLVVAWWLFDKLLCFISNIYFSIKWWVHNKWKGDKDD